MPYYSKTKIKRALTVTIAYKIDEQSMGVRMFVVLVEDDPYISHFLQMSFEQEGYRILMTTKGHEALSLFYSHQPDIVILDLGLPDIDGLEVIQEIRKISSKPIMVCREMESKWN